MPIAWPRRKATQKKTYKHKSDVEKARILQSALDGIPWKTIINNFNTSSASISRIIKKYYTSGAISRKPGSGRKRKTSVRDDRDILLAVKRNHFISSTEIQKSLPTNISQSTIRRRISESSKFKIIGQPGSLLFQLLTILIIILFLKD